MFRQTADTGKGSGPHGVSGMFAFDLIIETRGFAFLVGDTGVMPVEGAIEVPDMAMGGVNAAH